MFRHDGTLIHLAAFDSVEGVDLQPLRHTFPAPPERVTFAGRVVATARLLYIADIEHDRDAPPTLVEFARANSFRSIFAAPMLRDGHAICAIGVTHRDVDGFNPSKARYSRPSPTRRSSPSRLAIVRPPLRGVGYDLRRW